MSDNDYYEQPCHRDPKGARSAATLRELNMKLRAENERLRELEAELARLQAALQEWRDGFQGACYACEPVGEKNIALRARIAELEAERDRLRGLLSWAAGRLLDAGDVEGHEKVMAALEQSND